VAIDGPIYRCGNEYKNDVPDSMKPYCTLIEGGEVVVKPGFAPKSSPPIKELDAFLVPSTNWTLVASGGKTKVYVDRSTIKAHGKILKAWVLWTNLGQKNVYGKDTPSNIELDYFNCAETSMATKSRTIYGDPIGKGEVVESRSTPDDKLQFEEFSPNTYGATLIGSICKR
jgi:hypothetical protein